MIVIFLQLLLLLLGICMFYVSRLNKYKILIFSSICFTCVTITYIPFGNMRYFLSICFFLSEIPYIISHLKFIKSLPIFPLLSVMIVSTIILAINSPHYQTPYQWIRLIIFELIGKYFILFYAFISIKSDTEMYKILNAVYYAVLLLFFYGITNLFLGYSLFVQSVGSMASSFDAITTVEAGSTLHLDRFRVHSMFFNPFDYGYICIMIFLLYIWGYFKEYVKKAKFLTVSFCCLFGILFCGCRTNYLACFTAVVVYYIFAFSLKKIIKYFGVLFIGFMIAYMFVPIVSQRVDEMTTMFDQSSDFEGSSIEMRVLQYTQALYHISESPLFGRGKDFFYLDMGWKDGKAALLDKDLWGAEGVILIHLLEYGIVGTLFYVIFYISLIKIAFKYRKKDKNTFSICLAVLTAYTAMANISGELGSVMSTLLLSGAFLSILYSKPYYEIQYNNSSL